MADKDTLRRKVERLLERIRVLDHKAQQLRNSIAYAGRDVQRYVTELENVAVGYVDWDVQSAADGKEE